MPVPNSQVVLAKPDGGFSVLAAGTDGQVLTADAAQPLGAKWAFPPLPLDQGVRLTHSVNQNVSNAVETALTFDTEKYDTGGMHSGTNPTRITFPGPGKYLVIANCTWAGAAGNSRSVFVRLNGTTQLGNTKHAPTPGGLASSLCLSVIDQFNAGDYVEMTVVQDSGGVVAVLGQATVLYSPWFSAQKIV